MYDKIASAFNEKFDSNVLPEDVEAYLRYGDTDFLEEWETVEIEKLLDQFL